MSTLFSISDVEFDDLEDDEFLIEACNFGTNQLNNNCLDTNLRKTGHNIPTNGQHLSDTMRNDKLNSVNGLARSTTNCDNRINSPVQLRPSPANSKIILNDGYDYTLGKRQQHTNSSSEPPSKKPTSFTKENTPLTSMAKKFNSMINETNKKKLFDKASAPNHRSQKELLVSGNIHLESCCLPKISSKSNQGVDYCLRYTQNTKTVDSLDNRCISQPKNSGFETEVQSLCNNKTNTNVKTNSINVPQSRQSCGSPLLQNGGDKYLQTDLAQHVLCRNKTLPSVNETGHCEPRNSDGANTLRQSPNQVSSNKKILDGKCITPKTRRFPGPAGILPRLEPGQKLESFPSPLVETPKKKSPEICHMVIHDNDEEFSTEPWTVMQDEIEKRFHAPFDSLAVVVKKAGSQQLDKGKVAFLGVLVKTFCPTGLDVSVVLKDPSGEMQGTLHRKVLEEHQIELGPGCGLLLKQVSVFSPSPRKHYLNITPGNIVEIFPACAERLSSSRKIFQDTPKRQPSQISCRSELIVEEQTTQNSNLHEDNFDDLLEGLDADDDIFAEAMNF